MIQCLGSLIHTGVFPLHNRFLHLAQTVAKRGVGDEGEDEDGQAGEEGEAHVVEEEGEAEAEHEGEAGGVGHGVAQPEEILRVNLDEVDNFSRGELLAGR